MSAARQLGRRAFLRGAGGAMLGLPFLHALSGRTHAQAARPVRVVVFFHPQGTLDERFRPAAVGNLPATLPALLSPLEATKSRMLLLSGIDNIVAALNTASNGHNGSARSLLTCQPFQGVKQGQNPVNGPADGPSIDAVLGAALQGGAPRSVINLGVTDDGLGENAIFWRAAGQSATITCDPRSATSTLFSDVVPPSAPAPVQTPEQILRSRRGSVLDAVGASFQRLAQRVPSEDRVRLEAHRAQVRALELVSSGAGEFVQASCAKPTPSFPSGYAVNSPTFDDAAANAQIENLVMSLACDLTRVATLQFTQYHSPNFAFLFDGDTQAVLRGSRTYSDWHAMVHEAKSSGDAQGVENLARGFTWYMQKLALLVKRLGEIEDGPDGTLLDNTLVLSISEFGNGSQHATSKLPVLLFGLKDRIRAGQHVDLTGYTTGDLFTTMQAITTGVETPFGVTGANSAGRAYHRGLLPIT